MFPTAFDYHRAESVEDALRLLSVHEDAKLLAGGHSLLPMMKLRLAAPEVLIDIGRIPSLRGAQATADGVRIGALTTHHVLATDPVVAEWAPLIAEAASKIADPAVRHRGTIGGNIAHADPASDLPATLVALGATVHLTGHDGARQVAASDFFTGLLETDLGEQELLTAIDVPAHAGAGTCYAKHEHPASGYAVVGAAAVMAMQDGVCTAAALVLNGVAAVPPVVDVTALVGGTADDGAIARALDGLSVDDPLGDLHASGEYRVHLAKVYGRRALASARNRARDRAHDRANA
jgi:carbon-monoxide dehydrogenase medium subunit